MEKSVLTKPPLVLVAAALIQDRNRQVLLTCRRPGDTFALCWEFPGGKVEIGETPEEALVREMTEEVGIQVSALKPWFFASHTYDHFHLLMTVFRCGHFRGEPRPLDVYDVRWFSVDEMRNLVFPPADLPLLQKLREEESYLHIS